MNHQLIELSEEELAKLKKLEMYLFEHLKKVCDEHNLRFWAGFGTLLGAVRHQGFIPWDDDMDFYMPCEDYFRLIQIMAERPDKDIDIEVACPPFHSYRSYMKIKLRGTRFVEDSAPLGSNNEGDEVFIDIFPLFSLPESGSRKRIIKKYLFLQNKASCYFRRRRFLGKMKKAFYLLWVPWITPSTAARRIQQLIRECSVLYKDSNWLTAEGMDIYQKHAFDETRFLPFEGTSIPVPSGYDELLTVCYGDYMELPPVEKRKSVHFLREISFGEWEKRIETK